jgi:hypothetical protein
MRLTEIGLYSNGVEACRFSLRSTKSNARYMVRQVIGLDADEITPKFYGFGRQTSNKFYDFSMKPRELVILVALNPTFKLNEEYSDIRDDLYKAISSSRTGYIDLLFYSGAAAMAIVQGFIVKMEAGYFQKNPEVQITIRCDDALFRGVNPVHTVGEDIPHVNPIRVPDSQSTSPHGLMLHGTFTAPTPSFTIQDKATDPDWKMTIIPDGGFLTGDMLHLSNDNQDKHLYIDRGGTRIYLVDKIETGSIWPMVFPGGVELHFVNLAQFAFDFIEYHPAYWGI